MSAAFELLFPLRFLCCCVKDVILNGLQAVKDLARGVSAAWSAIVLQRPRSFGTELPQDDANL
jgi:hypothetical protein